MSVSLRCAFVTSSAGSIMAEALKNPLVRNLTHVVLCDRPCASVDRAREHGVSVEVISEPEVDPFCDRLLPRLDAHRIDYVFSFYTQFYSARLRAAYRDRLFNFHPSLLPAFKGMDGFGDALAHGVSVMGSTVELIDQVMDEGKIVMQSAFRVPAGAPPAELRHRLYVQQCKSLLQTARWIVDARMRVQGRRVEIERARFDSPEFSPALDWDEAAALDIPYPGAERLAALGVGPGADTSLSPLSPAADIG